MAKPTKPVNAPRPGRHGGPGGVIEKPQNFWKSAVRLAKYFLLGCLALLSC